MSTLPQIADNPIARLTTLIRLVCDDTRLRLLLLLAEGERDVSGLCAAMALPQPTVSHHLGLLLMQRVVAVRRDGRRRFYALDERVASGHGDALDLRTEEATVRIVLWSDPAVALGGGAKRDGATDAGATPTAAGAAVAATVGARMPLPSGGSSSRTATAPPCSCSQAIARKEPSC